MERRDARRAEELANLKLALAAFALQLDAFEARLKRRQVKIGAEPSLLPDSRFAQEVFGGNEEQSFEASRRLIERHPDPLRIPPSGGPMRLRRCR